MPRRKSTGTLALSLFLLVGLVFACVGYFAILRPELEVGRSFVEGTCTILGKELVTETRRKRRSGSRPARTTTVYRPEFHIRHEVGGKAYEARTFRIVKTSSSSRSAQERELARFEQGKSYPCWYDPGDPARVVLEKGLSAGGVLFLSLGGLLVLVGAGRLVSGILRKRRTA